MLTRPYNFMLFTRTSEIKLHGKCMEGTLFSDVALIFFLPPRFPLKDQYGPRVFFLEFPFFAENMIIRSILNLWWHSEILKLILGVVRGMFTKRLKGTRRLLYTVKSDFFEMTALHSKC